MDFPKLTEIVFTQAVQATFRILLEKRLSLGLLILAAPILLLVHNHLSEHQYRRIRHNPKYVIATIYLLALIVLLFCLGGLFVPPSDESKMVGKTTEHPSSTVIQSASEKNKQLTAWIDKIIDNLKDKEDQKKITDIYERVLSLTRENERCSGQLKYCSDQLAAKQ